MSTPEEMKNYLDLTSHIVKDIFMSTMPVAIADVRLDDAVDIPSHYPLGNIVQKDNCSTEICLSENRINECLEVLFGYEAYDQDLKDHTFAFAASSIFACSLIVKDIIPATLGSATTALEERLQDDEAIIFDLQMRKGADEKDHASIKRTLRILEEGDESMASTVNAQRIGAGIARQAAKCLSDSSVLETIEELSFEFTANLDLARLNSDMFAPFTSTEKAKDAVHLSSLSIPGLGLMMPMSLSELTGLKDDLVREHESNEFFSICNTAFSDVNFISEGVNPGNEESVLDIQEMGINYKED